MKSFSMKIWQGFLASLLLLCLCAPSAHAGQWEFQGYYWSGSANSVGLNLSDNRDGSYKTYIQNSKRSARNQLQTQGNYTPDSASVAVRGAYSGANFDSTLPPQKGSPGASGSVGSSVYAVFHWKRNLKSYYNGTMDYPETIPDPDDNPPTHIYVREKGTIYGNTGIYQDYQRPTGYDDADPWPGNYYEIKGSGMEELSLGDRHRPDNNQSTGWAYGPNSKTIIRKVEVENDQVIVPSRSFHGEIKLSPGYEKEDQSLKIDASLGFSYEADALNVGVSANPVGPFSVVKNEAFSKQYNGITRWSNKMTDDDGTFNVLHVEPIITANSYFSAWAKNPDGSDVFPNQKYIWDVSPDTYIPVPPHVDSVNSILYKWTMDGAVKQTDLVKQYNLGAVLPGGNATANGLNEAFHTVNPPFRDNFISQWQMAQQAANPPAEQKVDTSTPTKDLSWEFGSDYKSFGTKTSTVHVLITGQNPDDPVLDAGTITINWKRPKKCVFKVKIYGTTWHIPQGEGFTDVVKRSFNADGGLAAQVEGWAGMKIANLALLAVPGGGEVAGAAEAAEFEITTVGESSAQAVADQFAADIEKSAIDAVADDVRIPRGAQSETKIEVTPQAEPGEAPEPPVTRVIPKGRGDWPIQRATGDTAVDKVVREVDNVNKVGTLDPVNCGACTAAALMRDFGVDVNAVASTFDKFPNGMGPEELQEVMMKRGVEMTNEVECKTVADLQAQLGQLQPNQRYAIAEYNGVEAHWYNATPGENGTILYDTQKGAGAITPNADSNFWVYVFER